jgi:predicted Zn-dependent protease
LGKKVMGDNVTIYDDALDPKGMACPFDFEGLPKKRLDVIDKGVGKGVAYDLMWAKKEGKEPTGHGLPSGGQGNGGIPLNIVFAPGDATKEDMLKTTDKGLLVTRFHYVNGLINPPEAVMTGMTRDGTFLIENGEVKSGIKNLRFTESLLKAFSNIALLGKDLTTIGAWWGDLTAMRVPAMLIRDFTFSGKTEF